MAFEGAEQSIDDQKRSALNLLAQFGRSGMEQAVASQRYSGTASANVQKSLAEDAKQFGVNQEGINEMAQFVAPTVGAYGADARGNIDLIKAEQGAAQKVSGNYFDQARAAIPALRSNAAAIQEQYRRAYEQRQADRAAALQAAELQRQETLARMEAERRAAEQEAVLRELEEKLLRRELTSYAPVYDPYQRPMRGAY